MGWIFVPLFYGNLVAYTNQSQVSDYAVLESYYSLLEEIADDSFYAQASRLDEFLHEHPRFYRVYLTQLERYVAEDKILEAKSYFINTKRTADYRNSQWMLAKIYAIQDSVDQTFATFIEAFKGNNAPNLSLLFDFFYSYYRNSQKFDTYTSEVKCSLSRQYENIADAIVKIKNWDFKEALEILDQLPTELHENLVISEMRGFCLYRLLKYSESEARWREGLNISRDRGDKHSEGILLIRLGMINSRTSNYDEAIENYESSNKIAENLKDLLIEEKVKGNLAGVSLANLNYEEALELYDQALNIALSIANYDDAAIWNFRKASTLKSLKRIGGALRALEESLIYADRANNNSLSMSIKIQKGNILSTLGLNKLAIKYYQGVIELAKKYNKTSEYYKTLGLLAYLKLKENKYQEARQLFLQALENTRARQTDRAFWRWQIARSYELEKVYDKAIHEYIQAFNFMSNIINPSDYILLLMAEAGLVLQTLKQQEAILPKLKRYIMRI